MTTDAKALTAPAVEGMEAVLSPAEKKFCEWRVEKFPANVSRKKQAEMLTKYTGQPHSVADINKLLMRRAFRRYYVELRAKSDEQKAEGLVVFKDTIPEAMRLQQKAVTQMLADAKVDIRAVPAIVAPFNDYVAPKKQLSETHATVVTINITATQQAGLDLDEIVVEAEEVEAEIIQ